MKRLFLTLLCMMCLSLTVQTYAQKKVHTIGDSTMDSYTGGGTDKMGWGGVLQQFFNGKDASNNSITVNNRGKSGSSSRTFYTDARYWATMKTGGSDALTANASSDSEKGYVFEGCTIVSECPVISLGRSWNQAPQCIYLNTVCDFSQGEFTFSGSGIQRWTIEGMNVLPKKFGEYNTTLKTASRSAESEVVTPASNEVTFTYNGTTKKMETVLTAEEAANYTVESVLGTSFKNEIENFLNTLTSISYIKTTMPNRNNNIMYSITGQRVNASHKGIVIINGKKILKLCIMHNS